MGTPGRHFDGLGVHFGGPGRPLDTRGDVWGSDVVFVVRAWWIWGARGGAFGGNFGDFFDFLMLKCEVRLQTSFLWGFWCPDVEELGFPGGLYIVNNGSDRMSALFGAERCPDRLGGSGAPFWEDFGDLWYLFCDFLVV